MPYSSNPDPHLITKTKVLRNLLGITNQSELDSAEADITAVAIASLSEIPFAGEFNLEHFKDIHWELFNQIYGWAGQIWTTEIGKENIRFANSDFIKEAASALFEKLRMASYLKNLQYDHYTK
jgi:cell filamentation protein